MTTDLFTYAVQLAREAGAAAMTQVAENAGPDFRMQATAFVVRYLETHAEASSEEITDACEDAGIRPHDSRAFGPVYMSLQRKKVIEKCGQAIRLKGHGTSGGNLWKLVNAENL